MAIQFSFGKIVTNGLVLALNAADRNSYLGSGNDWIDLSANNNNGTLTNGPTFNTTNGGNIVLDGTNDFVNCGNNSSLQITVGTISSWVKTSIPGSSYRGIITKQSAWGLFLNNGVLIAYDWGGGGDRTTGINIADNTWKNVVMTFTETVGTPSNNAIVYLNGVSVLTATVRHVSHSVSVQIGDGNASQNLNGSVSTAMIYNRVLSASEIQQNYNAQKSRFGL